MSGFWLEVSGQCRVSWRNPTPVSQIESVDSAIDVGNVGFFLAGESCGEFETMANPFPGALSSLIIRDLNDAAS